jgi:hypothetical protein
MDLSGIKTKPFNGNILTTGGISDIFTDFENNWDRFGLVAIAVIEIAHLGFDVLDSSITGLPHHGDVLVFGDGSFSDLTSGGIEIPIRETSRRINSIFEIDLISTNFGIDEWKLITVEIFDKSQGILWIEPHLSDRFVVGDSW